LLALSGLAREMCLARPGVSGPNRIVALAISVTCRSCSGVRWPGTSAPVIEPWLARSRDSRNGASTSMDATPHAVHDEGAKHREMTHHHEHGDHQMHNGDGMPARGPEHRGPRCACRPQRRDVSRQVWISLLLTVPTLIWGHMLQAGVRLYGTAFSRISVDRTRIRDGCFRLRRLGLHSRRRS